MKSALALLALVASSTALAPRWETCCAGITAYGGPGGPVGQLSDGQNRIGDSGLPLGQYCLANGGFTDGQGRGCILTPPTTQWQCDVGAAPTTGFEVSCNGTISYDGQDTFWACATGDNGGYNIYSKPIPNEPTCTPTWLMLDGCYSTCPAPPPPPPPAPTTTWAPPPPQTTWAPPPPPTTTAPPPAATCPAELTGNWQFPHLIVPVNSAQPNQAYGTQFNGTAEGTISSIFNFDIPQSYAGMQCSLEFLFPMQDQLETSAYEFSPGMFDVAYLQGAATSETTYASQPSVVYDFGTFALKPGTATEIGQWPDGCAAGQTISFKLSAEGAAMLNYFQDYNPCPIGFYVTAK